MDFSKNRAMWCGATSCQDDLQRKFDGSIEPGMSNLVG